MPGRIDRGFLIWLKDVPAFSQIRKIPRVEDEQEFDETEILSRRNRFFKIFFLRRNVCKGVEA